MRSGIVAVAGRPNVGKSSLVNALVGRKVSIVAPKPQTTRHRIQCVMHHAGDQVVFVDTPGLHRQAKRALNRYMNEAASGALADADLILFVIEAGRWTDEDEAVLARLKNATVPVALVLNKVDKADNKNTLLPLIEHFGKLHDFSFIMPFSATQGDNREALVQELLNRMPEGPPLYPPDQISDRDAGFMISEMVREKLIRALGQELPYAIAVSLDKLEREGALVKVEAVIWVEREGQKKIVIGEQGVMLKRVGSAARRELEALYGGRFYLRLWVKVKDNWTDDSSALKRFGYSD